MIVYYIVDSRECLEKLIDWFNKWLNIEQVNIAQVESVRLNISLVTLTLERFFYIRCQLNTYIDYQRTFPLLLPFRSNFELLTQMTDLQHLPEVDQCPITYQFYTTTPITYVKYSGCEWKIMLKHFLHWSQPAKKDSVLTNHVKSTTTEN